MNKRFPQGGMNDILYTFESELESEGSLERQDTSRFNDEGKKSINNGAHVLFSLGSSKLTPCTRLGRLPMIHMRVKYST